MTKRSSKSESKGGISESDIEDEADVRHVGASEVLENGYQI